jgi:ubiquinone/menaquinone biosynthesis C-methylase UbiE
MNLEEYERMYRFEDKYWWFVARRRLIVRLIADLNLPEGLEILDIGCGTGAMLDELERFGRVVGADFSEEALAFCRKRGARVDKQYRLVRADARCLPFESNSFDIVSAMDIIEHIDHDKAAMAEIYRVLKPGGRLLATVPAYMYLWSEHDVALHHHRRYTAQGLRDIAQRAGFGVEHISYTVTSLLPAIALIRRLERLTKRRNHAPQADVVPVPSIINQTLLAMMDFETQIVRRLSLPFGVTVVAVARKAAH